jgi:hypothetical protein
MDLAALKDARYEWPQECYVIVTERQNTYCFIRDKETEKPFYQDDLGIIPKMN